ncbi:LytR C-terminal domain-containing protein [Ruania albidiflava]|uniref:LytR C-terminal domain-containing protein n=1 Tax=Ruania albidiflava TaxID=366586 RepID=UPI0023F40E1B|nr:LytR C-terminal domain-containing protein [Ruania albidiflava]
MTKQPYAYDEDEFDALGADRVPVGVHRRPVPWWRHALPFVAVLILAPLLAFVVVQVWSQESDQVADPTPEVTAPADEGSGADEGSDGEDATGSEETTGGPESESPTEEETTADDLDRDLGVWVLNGAGVSGLAGEAAARLQEDGWTNVEAADYSHELPTDSAIFYTTADMAEEAEAIGEELGISTLYEDPQAASNGVVIVLRPDFQG